jgi:hypothetical protein
MRAGIVLGITLFRGIGSLTQQELFPETTPFWV